ncbi:MAG: hypothetical protein ABSB56_09685 [Nitrososphaerales archaeon]|jgi:hypothetical protein
MHKQALVLGLLLLFISVILTAVLNELASSYIDLQPLAVLTLILLVVGTVATGYSIWDEVVGRPSQPAKSSQ